MSIGARLKQERERLGLTIPAFAEIAGAKKNTVIDWQNDKSSPPAEKLTALSERGVDVSYVLTGKTMQERLAELDRRVDALGETTKAASSLDLPKREGAFVRDVLYGMALKDPALVRETIENYVAERQAKTPRKKGTK